MKRFLVFCLLLSSFSTLAYVDMSLNYTHSIRQVNGIETDSNPEPGSAITTNSGYTLNWAWFIWEYTALELNYSSFNETLVDDRPIVDSVNNITRVKSTSTVLTEISGVGIRQAFASRKSAIIPTLSIGYAQFTTSSTSKTLFNVSGTEIELEDEQEAEVFASSYASFSLRFRVTQLMGLTLAAKAVMPDFETEEAMNNVTYSAGFSWIF